MPALSAVVDAPEYDRIYRLRDLEIPLESSCVAVHRSWEVGAVRDGVAEMERG